MNVRPEDLPLESVFRWERERADRIFLTQPYGSGQVRHWTWAQAVGEARRMAAYLKAQGWEPGSRIAILSKNCAWWVMADLAIWMAGHVSVPIYPSLRAQSIRQILEHSDAVACFVGAMDDAGAEALAGGIAWIYFPTAANPAELRWESVVQANAPIAGNPVRRGAELATIIYTSGTTGTPKGVMHSFLALAYNAMALNERLHLNSEQRVFSYLPLAHIVERAGLEGNVLRLGCRMFFTEGIDTFLQDLHRARPTIFVSVPRLLLKFQQGVFAKISREKLERLLRIPVVSLYVKRKVLRQLGLSSVTKAACGAAPLPPEMLIWYRKLGLRLGEGYGMTETMITHFPRLDVVRPGYVGAPLDGVEQKLGEGNELLLRSPMNMMGYHKDAAATAASFTPDGFLHTGDVAEIAEDGQVKIIGRIKEQFKTSKGKYVAPAPIEARLMEHPGVEACCLMGAGQPSPFAIVVLSDAARAACMDRDARDRFDASLEVRMRELNRELDPFERLSMIVIAEGPWTTGNGFLTPTLKIRRGSLEGHYQQLIEEWRAQERPVVWESSLTPPYVTGATAPENSLRSSEVPPSQP